MDKKLLEALMNGFVRNRSNYDTKQLEMLVKSNDRNDKDTLNSTVVDILESDDTVAFEFLIANEGINIYSKEYDNKTPLSVAASAGSIKIVELLLRQMDAEDICKYNEENLLQLEFPKMLPDLWLVEDVTSIVNLFIKKKIVMTLKHKLAVLEFLVHNTNNCDCGNSEEDTRDLKKKLRDLITYGSAVHVEKIISKIRNQMAAQKLKLNELDLINYIGKPLSPGILLNLHVDQKIVDIVENIQAGWKDSFPMKPDHGNEYKRMKTHKLNDNLFLHDVLAMDPCKNYHHVIRLNFHQMCKRYTFASDYMKGLKAKSLIRHQVEEFLPSVMEKLFPPLPDRCFNNLLYYMRQLNNEDILSMCQVAVTKK